MEAINFGVKTLSVALAEVVNFERLRGELSANKHYIRTLICDV